MLTATSFKHPRVRAALAEALNESIAKGYSVAHVRNRQGRAYLALRYRDNTLEITDRNGKNITDLVVNGYY